MFVRHKAILTAAVILAAFMIVSFVHSSDVEIHIIDMYTPSEAYNNGYFYHYAYIDTDIAYDSVYWYIEDPDGNFQYVGETLGEGGNTRAYFYPDASDCPGNIKGKKHRIAAKAWYYNRETETSTSDYMERDFRVYQSKTKIISGIKQTSWEKPKVSGVYGYVELSRHYHDGRYIVVDGSVSAYNGTDKTCSAKSWFRHTEYDANLTPTGWSRQDPDFGDPNPATPNRAW